MKGKDVLVWGRKCHAQPKLVNGTTKKRCDKNAT